MTETKSTTRTAPVRSGALVRPGLTSRPLPTVSLDPRTAYDFLMSSCGECGSLEDLLPEDRVWAEEARASLAAQVANDKVCGDCHGFVVELSRLLPGHPEIETARQFVALIDGLSDRELLDTMIGELLEMPEFAATARRAIDGDPAGFAELQSLLADYKGHAVLTAPFEEMVPWARSLLHAWLPLYEKIEGRVGRMLVRDVAARQSDEATSDPIGFVERTTNGIRLILEPTVRRIVLAPSYFGRPFNSLTRLGEIQLISYPIADSSLGERAGATPPAATLRLFRALGDETRLRILRLVSEQPRYLTELANELELSKPTVSHHMAQLRSAGLVTTTEQGNLTYYTLRQDRIVEAGPELGLYLKGK